MRCLASVLVVVAACGGTPHTAPLQAAPTAPVDPDGPHRAAVAAQVQPLIDGEVATGIVVGLYDAGKLEIYGFGKGPDGKPPTGSTLFELGSVTKVYTGLLLADAVQRREVSLDTQLAELLPPGVTAPTKDGKAITLRHLALHSSGLPRLPPTVAEHADAPDPYGKYTEETLYADLVRTQLETAPGAQILYSNYGAGVLGFVLGHKLGTGFPRAVQTRVLAPLGLHDTFFTVPPAAQPRRAHGTDDDLKPVPYWTFDALAGAGALISDAHDQLLLVNAELDAAAGSKEGIRAAMRLTQEPALEHEGDNEGLGWQIDGSGRYWHNGGTGGFRSFVGFDPKNRRGIVILASTSVSTIDHLAEAMYKIVANETVAAPKLPSAADLASYTGDYDFQGMKIKLVTAGKRLYVEGPGQPRIRMLPISDKEFWIEQLQSVAAMARDGDKITHIIFVVGDHQMIAKRL